MEAKGEGKECDDAKGGGVKGCDAKSESKGGGSIIDEVMEFYTTSPRLDQKLQRFVFDSADQRIS